LEIKHFFCTLIKQKLLNFPFYIAQRVAANGQKSFARLIIRIAITAVALSIAVMIIASSLIKGFKSEISNKMFGFWGHIHIASTQQTTTLEPKSISANPTFLQELKNLKNVPDTEGGIAKSKKGVLHVQSYAQKAGIIKTKDNFEGIVLKGVGKDFDWQFVEQSLIEGRRLQSCDTCRDILISKSTAGRMKLKLGSKFVVHFVQNTEMQQRLFQVSGIYNTGLEEYDKKFALVDIKIIQDLLGWSNNEVAGFEVFIEDISDLAIINNYIYKEVITNDLFSQSVKEEQESIFNWLDLQDVNEYIILGMMLIVSIINMVTALLILILERTNMIGLLKALGIKNWSIQQVFLYYGAIIIGMGLLIGNIMGLSIAWLEKTYKFVKLPEADYYLSYAPIEFNFWYIVGLNIGTFFITTIFLLLPTLLVLSITPVKALHFK
jgi:lipoprotein-releasing system permease protein